MAKGIFYGGRSIIKPGVYSTVDVEALVPRRLSPAGSIGVIGVATGGKPRTVTTINSAQEAKIQLRSGVLRNIIELMYDPSPEVQGAGEVKYYRINNAVAASLNLQDSVPGNVILVTAKDYGVWTNQIRIKVENGTTYGKKISINDVLNPLITEVGDNLGRAFSIHYTGGLTAARMTITKTGDIATSLLIEVDDGGGFDPLTTVNLTNPNLATVGALVDYLDNIADFDVVLIGDQNLSVGQLDAVSNQDVKTAAYNALSNIGAITHWINTNSQLVTASRVASATNAPANLAYTFLASGSEGAALQNSDWSTALDAFLTENVNFVFVCSEDAAIHAMALAHCNQASDVKERRERLTILGGAAAETVEQAVTRAQNLADKRSTLCYPGIKRINLITGLTDSLSPMYFAAIVTGMAAGVPVPTPLTFKQIRVSGLEKTLTHTEIERLLDRGVLHAEHDKGTGTFRIVQGITTYLKDANVIYRKVAGMRIHDYLQVQVRGAVEHFIGKVADKRGIQMMLAAVTNRLTQLTRSATNLNGVLTTGTTANGGEEPAFKNVRVVFDGFDLVGISFEAHPVGEVAYVTITASLTPTTIAAQA